MDLATRQSRPLPVGISHLFSLERGKPELQKSFDPWSKLKVATGRKTGPSFSSPTVPYR